MTWVSEIVWLVLGVTVLAWELVGVFGERKYRIEPLTRIMRDRLMRKHAVVKLGFLLFWAWLGLHWLLPLDW